MATMHLNCPHCRNPIEVVELPEGEVLCPSCGSSFHLTNANTTVEFKSAEHGQMFGRFVVQQQVGMGAFGTVYKAIDGDLRRTVALKVPRASNIAPSKAGIDRFLREARSAAQLRHPSIVTVHEVGVQNDQPYLVSDFVDGVTLADWLTAHEATFRQAAQWIAELADALHYAHTQGVIHRDVKPSNIMLARSPEQPSVSQHSGLNTQHLYLMDFGLAKRDAGEITMTIEGQVLGTPAYMSPEQARGEGHAVDGRADEYSLGVIFYELLTGELPFRGNVRMLMDQVLHEEAKSPRKINDRIPLDLETICLKAMAKEPGRRYASCAELATDLRLYLNGEPITARPVGKLERGWRWCKRNPVVAGLTVGIAIVLLAATVLSTALAFWALDEKSRADENAKKAKASEQSAQLKAEETREEKSKAERQLALQANREGFRLYEGAERFKSLLWFTQPLVVASGQSQVEAMTRDRLGAYRSLEKQSVYCRHLFVHQGAVVHAEFSPDGRRLVTASMDKTACVWDRESGLSITAPMVHDDVVWHASFSSDGQWIVTSSHSSVKVWNARTGQRLSEYKVPYSALRSTFSPDSKRVHTIYGQISVVDDSTLYFLSEGGAITWNVTTGKAVSSAIKSKSYATFSSDGKNVVVVSGDNQAQILDSNTALPITTDLMHPNISNVAISQDGRLVATSSLDGEVRIWDVASGKLYHGPMKHENPVQQVVFSNDSSKVVAVLNNNSLTIWDVSKGKQIVQMVPHQAEISHVTFSPDNRYLVSVSKDKTAHLLETNNSGGMVTSPMLHSLPVLRVAFSPDSRSIVTVSGHLDEFGVTGLPGEVRVWELAGWDSDATLLNHEKNIIDAALSSDGKMAVTASEDKTVQVWDALKGNKVYPPFVHPERVNSIAFSKDGKKIVSACDDKTVRIWDVMTGKPLSPSFVHRFAVNLALFHPANDQIYVVSGDEIHTWDLNTGKSVDPPMKHDSISMIEDFSFAPDGQSLVSASYKGAMIWNLQNRKLVKLIEPSLSNKNNARHAIFSPNGKQVLVASSDKSATVWNLENGFALIHTLQHQATVNKVAISNDSQWIATASDDKTARIWNARTGLPVTPPLMHGERVAQVSFSPDSQRVLTTSGDSTARVWDVFTGQPVTPSLLNNGPVHIASFSADGRLVITTGASTAIIWRLPTETRPADHLLKLANIYTGHKIDETGGLQPLHATKELNPWFQEMKKKYPEEFIPGYEDTRRWRVHQIMLSCNENNLPAALFHQNWLLAEAVQHAASVKQGK